MGMAVISSNTSIKVEPVFIDQSFASTIVTGNFQLILSAGSTSYVEISKLKVITGSSIQITIAPTLSPLKYVVKTLFSSTQEITTWNTANKLVIPCGCSLWVDTATAGSSIEIYGTKFINSP